MKIIFALFAITCIFATTSAYTRIVQNAKDPKVANKCYDQETKKYYGVGNNRVEGKCERAHCSLNDFELTYTG